MLSGKLLSDDVLVEEPEGIVVRDSEFIESVESENIEDFEVSQLYDKSAHVT